MTKIDKFKQIFLLLSFLLFCFGIAANTCLAQEDESKGVTSEDFDKRPLKRIKVTTQASVKSVPRYKKIVSSPPKNTIGKNNPPNPPRKGGRKTETKTNVPNDTETGIVGLTFWRRRQTKSGNETKGLGEREEKAGQKVSDDSWERLQSDTLLEPGTHLRISIESLSREGYLYIIDREQYSDGTHGEPKLIYPTAETRSNYVAPGKMIFIPPSPDKFFEVEVWGKGKKLTADNLTIIISPTMLIDKLQLDAPQTTLKESEVAQWEEQWEAMDIAKFEQIEGTGQLMAKVEEEASKGLGETSLTREDPAPQTVFKTNIKRGEPILLRVPLKYKIN